MSGIGDYVHATRIHYLKKSLNLYKEEKPPEPQELYNTQISLMKNEVARKNLENNLNNKYSIENMLNLFFHPAAKTNIKKGELNEADVETMKEALTEYMENKFGKDIYLDDRTLSVSSGVALNSLTDKETEFLNEVKKFNSYKIADGRSIKGIEDRYKALINFRDAIGKDKISSSLYKRLQDLDLKYEDFKEDVAAYTEASGNSKIIWRYSWLRRDSNGRRFDDELDDLIKSLKLTSAAKAQGEFGEVVAKATNYVLNHKGRVSKNQILKVLFDPANAPTKSRKGVKGSLISFYASYRDEKDLIDDSGNRLSFSQLQQDNFTVNLTEDKVDATLYFKDFGNINASIKNYNLSNSFGSLKLLQGKNLLALVQDYPYFINHFLNIVGTHTDTNFSPNDINIVHKAMKVTAFVKAISGGVYTDKGYSDKVDLFIVNDNSNGGYKVYYLSELLNKIINNIGLMNFSKYPDGIWEENDWAPPENKKDRTASVFRITRMVNKMKTMSLAISMSFDVLK